MSFPSDDDLRACAPGVRRELADRATSVPSSPMSIAQRIRRRIRRALATASEATYIRLKAEERVGCRIVFVKTKEGMSNGFRNEWCIASSKD